MTTPVAPVFKFNHLKTFHRKNKNPGWRNIHCARGILSRIDTIHLNK